MHARRHLEALVQVVLRLQHAHRLCEHRGADAELLADAALNLAQVRIEAAAEKDAAVAKAIAETEERMTEERMEAEQRMETQHREAMDKLGERLAGFNKTFKAQLKMLVEQPASCGTPNREQRLALTLA